MLDKLLELLEIARKIALDKDYQINIPLYVCGLFCANCDRSGSVSQGRQGDVLPAVFVLQVRDEGKRLDPILVEFPKLPEKERNQNLQMAQITIKYV